MNRLSANRPTERPSRSLRKTRYLDAARRLFATYGYAGTSMDMIVAEVGGSKATFYACFPSKQALVEGLIASVRERIDGPKPEIGDDEPLREALTRFGRATLEGVVSDAAVSALRLSLGEYHRFPELAQAVWKHGPAATYARFKRFLARRQARREIDVPDSQLAAEHFIAGIVGHIQLKVAMGIADPPSDREMCRRVEAAVETFVARYAVR